MYFLTSKSWKPKISANLYLLDISFHSLLLSIFIHLPHYLCPCISWHFFPHLMRLLVTFHLSPDLMPSVYPNNLYIKTQLHELQPSHVISHSRLLRSIAFMQFIAHSPLQYLSPWVPAIFCIPKAQNTRGTMQAMWMYQREVMSAF